MASSEITERLLVEEPTPTPNRPKKTKNINLIIIGGIIILALGIIGGFALISRKGDSNPQAKFKFAPFIPFNNSVYVAGLDSVNTISRLSGSENETVFEYPGGSNDYFIESVLAINNEIYYYFYDYDSYDKGIAKINENLKDEIIYSVYDESDDFRFHDICYCGDYIYYISYEIASDYNYYLIGLDLDGNIQVEEKLGEFIRNPTMTTDGKTLYILLGNEIVQRDPEGHMDTLITLNTKAINPTGPLVLTNNNLYFRVDTEVHQFNLKNHEDSVVYDTEEAENEDGTGEFYAGAYENLLFTVTNYHAGSYNATTDPISVYTINVKDGTKTEVGNFLFDYDIMEKVQSFSVLDLTLNAFNGNYYMQVRRGNNFKGYATGNYTGSDYDDNLNLIDYYITPRVYD